MSQPYPKWLGHLSVFTAYLIFGFNIIVCKDLTTQQLISPIGIFLLRSIGAGTIFWLLSLVVGGGGRNPDLTGRGGPSPRSVGDAPYQSSRWHVSRRDMWGIFLAAVLGYFLTQITFLMAIPLITPMESAMMSSLSPIYTMFIAAVAVHEPITWKKASGVLLSFAGIVYLILTCFAGEFAGSASNLWGIVLMVGNALCFSLYLGIFRPLIERYPVVVFMRWIFLFSTLMALPMGIPALLDAPWRELPVRWILELLYLIVMATFVAYFLIPLGQKIIRPTLVSMYSYVQPLVAISISIAIGMDVITVPKAIAAVMVFAGVYVVSQSRRKKDRGQRAE